MVKIIVTLYWLAVVVSVTANAVINITPTNTIETLIVWIMTGVLLVGVNSEWVK